MKITGQQLRVIVNRERKCWQEVDNLICAISVAPGRRREELRALSDVLAEIRIFRALIDDNTRHVSPLACQTVAELAGHE